MKESCIEKFTNFFKFCCSINDYDFEGKKRSASKRIIETPEEKIDKLISNKKIKGPAIEILRIMRVAQKLKVPEVMEILSRRERKTKKWIEPVDGLYSMIPEKDKKRYGFFNFIKLTYCIAKEQEMRKKK
ncbi:MAG: hypothetical protein LBT51_08925 [Fusobacteriaceae bacterium]|jgi:hypothetical protein|nr:hypothetical protein [Fusobacteriaceae bacterium]